MGKTTFILGIVILLLSCKKNGDNDTGNISPPVSGNWILNNSFSDDFDSGILNNNKWGRGVWYSSSKVFTFDNTNNSAFTAADGYLHLRAKRTGSNYTAASVTSVFKVQGNSKVVIRAKCIPAANNITCAIWMSSKPEAASNPNPEIDIQESMLPAKWGGGSTILASTLHYWPSPSFSDSSLPNSWSRIDYGKIDDWHIYILIRKNNTLYFYKDADTSPYWTYDVSSMPAFATMARPVVLSIEGHAGIPVLEDGGFVDFLIDYVYVYEWK